ncbi:MAG: hypothetical protein BroJett039_00040 [Chloroflexota bacterium]|nr:MAG: hypothetical protein BroJett039_00040 [Chloroflexota bacterium]
MNLLITSYFDEIEARFIASPVVISYQILRREVTDTDGIVRLKADLSDSSQGEFFENVIETNSEIKIRKYSFHWQDNEGKLIKRWDNAAHHKEFSDRHHLHLADGTVSEISNPLNTIKLFLKLKLSWQTRGNKLCHLTQTN